jgi:hypothetical protein
VTKTLGIQLESMMFMNNHNQVNNVMKVGSDESGIVLCVYFRTLKQQCE